MCRGILRKVCVGPVRQGVHRGHQGAAGIRERVGHRDGRPDSHIPLHQVRRGKFDKALGQDGIADGAHRTAKLGEPGRALEQVREDDAVPALAQESERAYECPITWTSADAVFLESWHALRIAEC
jgi:hypothetical protein